MYNAKPDSEIDRLVESYRPYAHAIARQILRHLSTVVPKEDILGYAELGLVEAARDFDPSRGAQFKTFSYYRIRGAVYDGLRKMGWFSRGLYHTLQRAAAANEFLANSSQQPVPDSLEQAEAELEGMVSGVVSSYLLSIAAEPVEDATELPDEQLRRKEIRRQIKRGLSRLPQKNRLVLYRYYFQERTLEEIARELNLSKSWLSRLLDRSLRLMKEQLEEKRTQLSPNACREVRRAEVIYG